MRYTTLRAKLGASSGRGGVSLKTLETIHTGVCETNGGRQKICVDGFELWPPLPGAKCPQESSGNIRIAKSVAFCIQNWKCSKRSKTFWANPPGQNWIEKHYFRGRLGDFPPFFRNHRYVACLRFVLKLFRTFEVNSRGKKTAAAHMKTKKHFFFHQVTSDQKYSL